jgi:AraC-like DNA-binding protein
VLGELGIAATLTDGRDWWPLFRGPGNVVSFELAHGLEKKREAYNARMLARACRAGRPVLGEHAGFHDLFVPIGAGGRLGVLVTGPFALERPSSSGLYARWREISGRQGQTSDPEFSRFVAVVLETLTLGRADLVALTRLVGALADALAEKGGTRSGLGRVVERLAHLRSAEQAWEVAHEIVDERLWRGWTSPHRARTLTELGLVGVPSDAIVGFFVDREAQPDPLDGVLRRDAFVRRAAEAYGRRRGVLCGRIGTHGVFLLCGGQGAPTLRRARLEHESERARALARSCSLGLHLGMCIAEKRAIPPETYRAALTAAEHALSRGLSFGWAPSAREEPVSVTWRDLRRELTSAVLQQPSALRARFEHYLEAVRLRSGYVVESFRTHLEAGFDDLISALDGAGVIDRRGLAELLRELGRVADLPTIRQISGAYRSALSALELALARPTAARRERATGRAIDYLREHFAEPITLRQVAKVAGFAPGHFSMLFRRSEGMTFRRYLMSLRIERAERMLTSTTWSIERVASLSGFPTRSRFHRAFRQCRGATPAEFRARASGSG